MEALNIFGGFAGIGILAAGMGFAYAQYRAGTSKAKDELILTLKESVDVEKDKSMRLTSEKETLIKSHQEQINELNKQIGILQGKSEANEKKMKEYMEILQGRNPEQEKFMEYITQVSTQSARYMKESSAILSDIKDFMGQMRANGYLVKKINKKGGEGK